MIFVIGCDGYLGNALVQRLLAEGHDVVGYDNFWRRDWIKEDMESTSAIPLLSMERKVELFGKIFSSLHPDQIPFHFEYLDIVDDYKSFENDVRELQPEAIFNLAHNPSAPFSMKSVEKAQEVLINNIVGTNNVLWAIKKHCPDCHYITIGTVGEYDHYGNIDIEEGFFDFEHKGRQSNKMIFPRRPGSVYHVSKTASTYLIDYLARAWKLKCTDVMQGIVFGSYTPQMDITHAYSRLDFDEAGGTVINRFIVQAILGIPLTIYGEGFHKRSFLSINDSIQALMIALNNPAKNGEVQTWNQLSEWHSMNDVAQMVIDVGKEIGLDITAQWIDTPRAEFTGEHYYNFVTENLTSKGYVPTRTIREEIKYCLELLKIFNDDNNYLDSYRDVVIPKINFK